MNIQCHHRIPSLQIEDCSVSSMPAIEHRESWNARSVPAIAHREMESSQCRAGADGEELLLGKSPIPILFCPKSLNFKCSHEIRQTSFRWVAEAGGMGGGMFLKWRSPISTFSQIWQYSKYESRKI
jgi:hypothetical protein